MNDNHIDRWIAKEATNLTHVRIFQMVESGQAIRVMDILTAKETDDLQTDTWIDLLGRKGLLESPLGFLMRPLDKEKLDYPELRLAVEKGWIKTCHTLIKHGWARNTLIAWALSEPAQGHSVDLAISLLKSADGFSVGNNETTKAWCSLAEQVLINTARRVTPNAVGNSVGSAGLQDLIVFLEGAWGRRGRFQNPNESSEKGQSWDKVITRAMDAFLQPDISQENEPKKEWAAELLETFLVHGANPDNRRIVANSDDGSPMTIMNFAGNAIGHPILHKFLGWWNDDGRMWAQNGPEQRIRLMYQKNEEKRLREHTWYDDVDKLEDDVQEMSRVMMVWLRPDQSADRTEKSDRKSGPAKKKKIGTPLIEIPVGGHETLVISPSIKQPILFSFQIEMAKNQLDKTLSEEGRGNKNSVQKGLADVLREKILDAWERAPREDFMRAAQFLEATKNECNKKSLVVQPQHQSTWAALGWATGGGAQELANLSAVTAAAHLYEELVAVEKSRNPDGSFTPATTGQDALPFMVQRISTLLRTSSLNENFEALVGCFLDELVKTWIPGLKGKMAARHVAGGNNEGQEAAEQNTSSGDIAMAFTPKGELPHGANVAREREPGEAPARRARPRL